MNMKKIAILALSLCMIAAIAVTGTIAYFTDTDKAENVFTVGNVDITLIESYLHRQNAYAPDGSAPATLTDEQIIAASDYKDNTAYTNYLTGKILAPGVAYNKMPYVKNESTTNDAFIRIRVMLPTDMDTAVLNSSVICTTALTSGEFKRPEGVGIYANDGVKKTVDGKEYNVYTFIRKEALAKGTMTHWNVWNQIRMDDSINNAELTALKDKGVIDENGQFKVIVEVDAIQADSFADVDAAFTAFDAQ